MNHELLLGWWDTAARDLPWRRPDCTAWGVLISEIMLQQTPVSRVEPIWHEWLARWPVPSAMAASSQGEVLRMWGKLGYPRRAMRLHEAATVIARDHGDVVPSDVETLESLPGIGSYTARAVATFAYGQKCAVVDTNVRRVVARAVHGAGDAGPPSTKRDLRDVEAILPEDQHDAAVFSAALMELGALICTAKNQKCADCPLFAECAWQLNGRPAYAGPEKKVQKFAGTDRQVRGKLLDVLRGAPGPVPKVQLDVVWNDVTQREKCLVSLLSDGLVEQSDDGLFHLPGEGIVQQSNDGRAPASPEPTASPVPTAARSSLAPLPSDRIVQQSDDGLSRLPAEGIVQQPHDALSPPPDRGIDQQSHDGLFPLPDRRIVQQSNKGTA